MAGKKNSREMLTKELRALRKRVAELERENLESEVDIFIASKTLREDNKDGIIFGEKQTETAKEILMNASKEVTESFKKFLETISPTQITFGGFIV